MLAYNLFILWDSELENRGLFPLHVIQCVDCDDYNACYEQADSSEGIYLWITGLVDNLALQKIFTPIDRVNRNKKETLWACPAEDSPDHRYWYWSLYNTSLIYPSSGDTFWGVTLCLLTIILSSLSCIIIITLHSILL